MDWNAAQVIAVPITICRANGRLKYTWAAGLLFFGGKPYLLSDDGKPNVYESQAAAINAASDFVKSQTR